VSDLPKYAQVAMSVRSRIAEGVLRPGESAPSGAALARKFGYSDLTCRKALRALAREGVLVAGSSANARLRVAGEGRTPDERARADSARALSVSLASRRRAAGLTQPELAALVARSVTTIGHAETGRLWQSRDFWERADKALHANGRLLLMYDAYKGGVAPSGTIAPDVTPDDRAAIRVDVSAVASVTVTWADGTSTTVHRPSATSLGDVRNLRDVPRRPVPVRERPSDLA
jgi:DNA-binding transcriptional regulator YhcF (GntR family)